MAYAATIIGILPRLNGVAIQGGMPVVFTGMIAGGFRVALFQVFLCFINVLIFAPFVKKLDKINLAESEVEN